MSFHHKSIDIKCGKDSQIKKNSSHAGSMGNIENMVKRNIQVFRNQEKYLPQLLDKIHNEIKL